ITAGIRLKQEKLRLWTNIHRCKPMFFRYFQFALQNSAWVTREWTSIWQIHITDYTCNSIFCYSREDDPGVKIRIEIHVGLFDAHVPFDGRAVEHHFVIQCFRQLANWNFNIFDRSKQVCEL